MLDFHGHFLPGIDDGAHTVEESLQMLCESMNQGIDVCFATPHCRVHSENDISEFLEIRKNALNDLVKAAGEKNVRIPEIRLGAEVFLDNDITKYEDYGKLCFEGTKYILLEFPVTKIKPASFDWIYEMTVNGLKPIIAHIDRYSERESIMGNLTGIDVIYQINAARFIRWSDGMLIKKILSHHRKFIVGTDMHNNKFRRPNLKAAYLKASKKKNINAEEIFKTNAQMILENNL